LQALLTSDSDRGTAATFLYKNLVAARTNDSTGRLRTTTAVVTGFAPSACTASCDGRTGPNPYDESTVGRDWPVMGAFRFGFAGPEPAHLTWEAAANTAFHAAFGKLTYSAAPRATGGD
jgi:hypothetical protein